MSVLLHCSGPAVEVAASAAAGHFCPRAWMLLLAGMVAVGTALAPGRAGADAVQPGLKSRFQQDLRTSELNNANLKPIGETMRYEAVGARVTLPGGQGQMQTTGLATLFQVHGDFEITLSYEVLKADRPKTGYGVGVSIYAAIDTDTSDAVSLARRVVPRGEAVFMSDRMTPDEGQAKHKIATRPSTASAGKLRLHRAGSKLRFLVTEENRPEFDTVDEVEFGTADVRWLQIAGDAGGSESGLDLRLLDLSVAAEDLPGLAAAPAEAPAQSSPPKPLPAPKQPSPPAPRKADGWGWLAAAVIAGLGIASSLAVGAWLFVRRSRRPGKRAAGTPGDRRAVASPVSFACSGCGKKLKAGADLAGKKVKCPGCGHAAVVPAIKVGDAGGGR